MSNLNKISSSFLRVYSPVGKIEVEADKSQISSLVQEERWEHRSGGREEGAGVETLHFIQRALPSMTFLPDHSRFNGMEGRVAGQDC